MSHHRLLFEFCDKSVGIDLDRTETGNIISLRHLGAYHRDICTLLDVEIKDRVEVLLVYAVTAGDNYIRLVAALEEIYVLLHGIGSTAVPPAVVGCDSRRKQEQSALLAAEIPILGGIQMFIQGTGVVL